jgi:hypothetical protein
MIESTDLKFPDIQALRHWVDKKSAESARGINHLSADQLTEGNFLLDLINGNQATYRLARRHSVEILESKNNTQFSEEKREQLMQEMSFRAFLVMMDPAHEAADYHALHSSICNELIAENNNPVRTEINPAIWLLIVPLVAGLLLLAMKLS